MRTIGASRGMMLRIFLMTGSSVGLIGTTAGAALGIAFACSILIVGDFGKDAINYLIDFQFGRAERDDARVQFVETTPMRALREPDAFPASDLGLRKALDMMLEEGMEAIWARHHHIANGVRAAVSAWGLQKIWSLTQYWSSKRTKMCTWL